MSVEIRLIVNAGGISQKKWEKVYEESCQLLKAFPCPLFCLKKEKRYGEDVLIKSKNIICNKGTADEMWQVSGDLISYCAAEAIALPKKKPEWCNGINAEKSVLWVPDSAIEYLFLNANNAFMMGTETKGYPYHFAILAVATLFESRFPEQAFVLGDITVAQAEKVVAWANTVLKNPIKKPILLDGERHYKYLKNLYGKPSIAMKRFRKLALIPRKERLEILFQHEKKANVTDYILEEVAYFSKPDKLGIVGWIADFLNATRDIKALIALILKAKKQSKNFSFPFHLLLKVLLSRHITTPIKERELVNEIQKTKTGLISQKEIIGAIVRKKISRMPACVDIYIKSEDLLALFASLEPKNRDKFKKIIIKEEKECQKEIAVLEEIKKKEENKWENILPNDGHKVKQLKASPEAKEMLKEAYQQKITQIEIEASIRVLEKEIVVDVTSSFPFLFNTKDADAYIVHIANTIALNQIALPEELWEALEKEKDIDLLRKVLALSLAKVNYAKFPLFRMHMLRHLLLHQ